MRRAVQAPEGTEMQAAVAPRLAARGLDAKQKAGHGVGHVLNDLASSVWFSYLIIYLTKVIELSNRHTGLVILLGQLADGIFTPFIGILCDRTVCRYGRRKIWHLVGSVLVTIAFPLLLIRLLSRQESDAAKMVYYVAIAAVFQFGWGCTQISHLSLIPEICQRSGERVELNAIRSAVTFLCGMYVYGVTWVLLGQSTDTHLTPNVWKQFMYLSFVIIGTGNIFNLIFHVVIREPPSEALLKWLDKVGDERLRTAECCDRHPKTNGPLANAYNNGGLELATSDANDNKVLTLEAVTSYDDKASSKNEQISTNNEKDEEVTIIERGGHRLEQKSRVEWLKDPALYKTALVYMCTRLVVNISQSYLPLYLTETLKFEKEAIAYFPLVVLVSGVLSSLLVKMLSDKLSTKITFLAGATIFIGACVWYYLQTVDGRQAVYAATVLMGSGSSIMLVTSLSFISDLVGYDKKSGAFIYGAISFCDKVSSGVVIAIIQELNPQKNPQSRVCSACADYVRLVQSIAPGSAALIALLFVLVCYDSTFVCRRKVETCNVEVQTDEPSSTYSACVPHSNPCACVSSSDPCACVVDVHRITAPPDGQETRF